MGQFDPIIQRTTEKLYEDERLRSHLTDDEAKVVLGWAEQWITAQVSTVKDTTQATQIAQNEYARVRQSVGTMNTLAAKPGALNLGDAVKALQLRMQPQTQAQGAQPRETVFKILTELLTKTWQTQGK